jgi:DNA primase
MNITDEIKDRILQGLDIIEVIGDAVQLHRRGSNYIGLCPFHSEKTPSFSVSPDRGIYKCFGCGVSGNVITFQMEYYRMTFPDAMAELAKRAGIQIEDKPYTKSGDVKSSKKDMTYKALQSATDYFAKMLNTTSGKHALGYFQKREFSGELIEKFKLGYSPDTWDALVKEMKKQGYENNALIDAGLVIEKDDNEIYDRFRNRVMFPIHDHLGKVVGFGARLLDDELKQAKYINSPQTIVYDKSKILYGLFLAKDEIRKRGYAILTEGYADVLSLYQAGYKNAVASSGTSLTKEQLVSLYRYCRNLYIVYDADSAGIKAAEKGLEIALEHGFSVLIVQLPAGEDPDSMIRNLGSKNFQVYIDEAIPFVDFLVSKYKKDGKLDNPATKSETIRMIMEIITKIPDRLQHDEYMGHLASLMNLSDRQVEQIYKEKELLEKKKKFEDRRKEKHNLPETGLEHQQTAVQENEETFEDLILEKLLPEEELLITLAVSEKQSIELMINKFQLKPQKLYTNLGIRLLEHIFRLYEIHGDIMKALFDDTLITQAEKNLITTMIFKQDKASENWKNFSNRDAEIDVERSIRDTILQLDKKSLDIKIVEIQNKLKEDIPLNNQMKLIKELQQLSLKKQKLEQLLLK